MNIAIRINATNQIDTGHFKDTVITKHLMENIYDGI